MCRLAYEYMNAVVDERKELFEKLNSIVSDLYPDAEVLVWYRLLTYRIKPGWVALGYRKDGVTLYTECKDAIEEYRSSQPNAKTGKGCINFKLGDKIPITALKKVIKRAMISK